MKAFWTYTLARLGVFLATWAVLWGLSRLVFEGGTVLDLWVLLLALIVSSIISILALRGMRDRVAIKLQERARSLNDRIEESRRAEDVD
ncbi:DUF4229 domain-containing protein [Aeromicrobium duanguangcaii]|uniref:DUF4229 domain-containing protein n=1 Tax=Aeromicrobium duanguangcaii TaxID=2968086 RepID=A0ABY5KIN0_9ACTN|nr:DUF4229 domain-containing protein [Aeromicrobium duanguangcaii]MCD9154021.1 DUF4229 domain-containing protein [Aeromicrobium duanguangcaii]MCL3837756.1 DUF4229 domain-containing protein [Aeromicrobium duanguangcaii]UUI68901.1 DUF4229 domain-containing protein [Aeromicrobium duanguangcaii]